MRGLVARPTPGRLAAGMAELLWPTRCAVCDTPGAVLCDECAAALPLIDQAQACPWCGAPYGRLSCTECVEERMEAWERGLDAPMPFERARCACEHRDGAARVVRVYKDGDERRLADAIARFMVRAAGEEWLSWATDLVYVPATAEARARRGFDHMALVAERVRRLAGVPVARALRRGKAADQRRLSRERRAQNAMGSFGVVPGALRTGARVLLIDDVFTTGSTLKAASCGLLAAGAGSIRALTFARVW